MDTEYVKINVYPTASGGQPVLGRPQLIVCRDKIVETLTHNVPSATAVPTKTGDVLICFDDDSNAIVGAKQCPHCKADMLIYNTQMRNKDESSTFLNECPQCKYCIRVEANGPVKPKTMSKTPTPSNIAQASALALDALTGTNPWSCPHCHQVNNNNIKICASCKEVWVCPNTYRTHDVSIATCLCCRPPQFQNDKPVSVSQQPSPQPTKTQEPELEPSIHPALLIQTISNTTMAFQKEEDKTIAMCTIGLYLGFEPSRVWVSLNARMGGDVEAQQFLRFQNKLADGKSVYVQRGWMAVDHIKDSLKLTNFQFSDDFRNFIQSELDNNRDLFSAWDMVHRIWNWKKQTIKPNNDKARQPAKEGTGKPSVICYAPTDTIPNTHWWFDQPQKKVDPEFVRLFDVCEAGGTTPITVVVKGNTTDICRGRLIVHMAINTRSQLNRPPFAHEVSAVTKVAGLICKTRPEMWQMMVASNNAKLAYYDTALQRNVIRIGEREPYSFHAHLCWRDIPGNPINENKYSPMYAGPPIDQDIQLNTDKSPGTIDECRAFCYMVQTLIDEELKQNSFWRTSGVVVVG